MGFYSAQVLPRVVDLACGTGAIHRLRVRTASGLHGMILEIGFGSGLNMPAYPSEVTRVYAVEPEGLGPRMAKARIEASPIAVDQVGLDGQAIPLADNSCDGAMCTFSLCTIPDPAKALDEVKRIVKRGGRFHFLEHGISPDAKVAALQRRFDPIERRVAGGCHLTRDPQRLVGDAGFVIESINSGYQKGPKAWTWITEGQSINP